MKLLEAAGPIFARLGFHAATVQEICQRAGANIAAVNYYFGDKLRLYEEVLRYSRESATVARPGLSDGTELSPEKRLQFFIRALLQHLFGEGRPSWFAQVIAHEMAQPTPALKHLIEREARPGFEQLKKIVSEIIGVPAGSDEVVLCANSIMGQCLHYFRSRPVVSELWPDLQMTRHRIDQIASHITTFSVFALTEIGRSKPSARIFADVLPGQSDAGSACRRTSINAGRPGTIYLLQAATRMSMSETIT